jgi:hypothetical protein
VEKGHPPRRSHCLLKLPPHLESLLKFPSKRYKDNKRGTYISTYQTFDYPVMSIESNLNVTRSPSTPIYFVISGIPSTPSSSMVGVMNIPTSTSTQPMCSTQPIGMNPFRCIFGMLGYNSQRITLVSNPFSFGIPNMMSQLSYSIIAANVSPIFGPRDINRPYSPLLFHGGHFPQINPTVGGWCPFSFGPNPSLNSSRWSAQLGRQVTSYISSLTSY